MTTKKLWQTASNWGFLCGAALFAVNILGWLLRVEIEHSAIYELMLFVVICGSAVFAGYKNIKYSGPEGYSYGQSVGFTFAMMLFAGIVYGCGQFLMYNFIAPQYYAPALGEVVDSIIAAVAQTQPDMADTFIDKRDFIIGLMKNPFVLILGSVLNIGVKGGVLGLVLGIFLRKQPDPFAPQTAPAEEEQNSNENENSGE